MSDTVGGAEPAGVIAIHVPVGEAPPQSALGSPKLVVLSMHSWTCSCPGDVGGVGSVVTQVLSTAATVVAVIVTSVPSTTFAPGDSDTQVVVVVSVGGVGAPARTSEAVANAPPAPIAASAHAAVHLPQFLIAASPLVPPRERNLFDY
jgi:hypothetical protein